MENIELGSVEETLFVPMRGRVYASENFRNILYDQKALEISRMLPQKYMDYSHESQYTLLASAIRSYNIDQIVQEFLERNPNATIINLGAGLETTYYRNSNNNATWYELDLEKVSKLRKEILGENDNDILSYSMFDYEWMEYVKNNSSGPYLIIASGVFYYFQMSEVLDLLNNLYQLENNIEVIFDCVSKLGLKFTKKYMKQLKKEDASMYFHVDNPKELINNVRNAQLINAKDFYENIRYTENMNLMTRISMKESDTFHMVKMIHLKIK